MPQFQIARTRFKISVAGINQCKDVEFTAGKSAQGKRIYLARGLQQIGADALSYDPADRGQAIKTPAGKAEDRLCLAMTAAAPHGTGVYS